MLDFKRRMEKVGIFIPSISIGSTPPISVMDELYSIDEIRSGNYVFYDYTQVALGSCKIGDCAINTVVGHCFASTIYKLFCD